MAAGAAFCVWFVVGDVFVAGHAGCAVGADLGFVNVVACGAFRVAFARGIIRNAMKPWELRNLVAPSAARLRGYRPAMRLVTRHALPMPLGALGQLLFMAAPTCDHASELVRASFMAGFAARMP